MGEIPPLDCSGNDSARFYRVLCPRCGRVITASMWPDEYETPCMATECFDCGTSVDGHPQNFRFYKEPN